ncbi:transcriptional regulator [Imbroritus primus]|uniref:Transcriptional regulator n=2 Tax=Imbroritus primus TaxID=3058603 RepID=A0ACD3SNX6_9BURK|nr:transcriptional regulator [Burkholderiaceae bacterium PBA]
MDLEQAMDQLGIRGKLYSAYMAALELGEATVNQIATRAGLGRTTAYSILERLEEEGLVTMVERGEKRLVVPEDPHVLLQRLENKQRTLIELMPQLRSLYNSSRTKPEIRFYEGEDAVRTVLWDTLTAQSKMLRGVLSTSQLLESVGEQQMEEYIQQRIARGIHLQVLRSASQDIDTLWPDSDGQLRELRYAPEHITLGMTTYVYDDKVVMLSSKREDYGLIIRSKDFANLYAAMFDGLWAISHAPAPQDKPARLRKRSA